MNFQAAFTQATNQPSVLAIGGGKRERGGSISPDPTSKRPRLPECIDLCSPCRSPRYSPRYSPNYSPNYSDEESDSSPSYIDEDKNASAGAGVEAEGGRANDEEEAKEEDRAKDANAEDGEEATDRAKDANAEDGEEAKDRAKDANAEGLKVGRIRYPLPPPTPLTGIPDGPVPELGRSKPVHPFLRQGSSFLAAKARYKKERSQDNYIELLSGLIMDLHLVLKDYPRDQVRDLVANYCFSAKGFSVLVTKILSWDLTSRTVRDLCTLLRWSRSKYF
jgi:hypothetical protein